MLSESQHAAPLAKALHFGSAEQHALQDGAGVPGVSEEQIDEIVGEGARDRGGKGNANVGDGGVAFVLGSSGPSQGGSETVSPPFCSLTTCFEYSICHQA